MANKTKQAKISIKNKRASFEYFLIDRLTAGTSSLALSYMALPVSVWCASCSIWGGNMGNYTMSNHLTEERANRLALLQEYLGYSDRVMIEVIDQRKTARLRLLSTGIILVLDLYEDFIITAYPATFERAVAIYKSAGKNRLPQQLVKRIRKNEERHPEFYVVK